jgi:NADPH-dependent 2,4-dienoyl-CoA reductase/sulfur reductase-like enzyme
MRKRSHLIRREERVDAGTIMVILLIVLAAGYAGVLVARAMRRRGK